MMDPQRGVHGKRDIMALGGLPITMAACVCVQGEAEEGVWHV